MVKSPEKSIIFETKSEMNSICEYVSAVGTVNSSKITLSKKLPKSIIIRLSVSFISIHDLHCKFYAAYSMVHSLWTIDYGPLLWTTSMNDSEGHAASQSDSGLGKIVLYRR